MTNHVQELLSRLDNVKPSGQSKWRATCPVASHSGRNSDLSVQVNDQEHLLIHCHAGHGAADVLGALGLTVASLYPRKHLDCSPQAHEQMRLVYGRRTHIAMAVAMATEARVLHAMGSDMRAGVIPSGEDMARIAKSCRVADEMHLALCRTIVEEPAQRLAASTPSRYRRRSATA